MIKHDYIFKQANQYLITSKGIKVLELVNELAKEKGERELLKLGLKPREYHKTFEHKEDFYSDIEGGVCQTCDCSFMEAVKSRGGIISNNGENEKWFCRECSEPKFLEFERTVKRFLKENNLVMKCPECGEPMEFKWSYFCEFGHEY